MIPLDGVRFMTLEISRSVCRMFTHTRHFGVPGMSNQRTLPFAAM